jgi:hypothetical protein
MKKPILKYRIGLMIVVVLVLGLAIFVAMQAADHKADLETKKAAEKVAGQLNNYVVAAGAPQSLRSAGIEDVPSTVKYTKLSEAKYRFCVKYKAADSGFDANSAAQQVALGLATGNVGGRFLAADSGYLYISSTHKKGENCQTVTLPGPTYPGQFDDQSVPAPGLENPAPSTDSLDGQGSGDSFSVPPQGSSDPYQQYPVQ